MKPLARVRIAEIVSLVFVLFLLSVWVATGHCGELRFQREQTRYGPFYLLLYPTLLWYLVPLTLRSVRKLSLTLAALRAGSLPASLWDLSEERRALASMAGFLRDCLPLYLTLVFYPTSDFLIDCLQGARLADAWLIRIDLLLFGGHPSVWMESFISGPLTDLMSFCYFLHLLVPIVVLSSLLILSRRRFVEAVQGWTVMVVAGVLLYVLVPAVGPLHSIANLYSRDLSGGLLTKVNQAMIESTRVPRDAFPSLHVALSSLMVVYAWRARRWLGVAILLPTIGNWIATIYLRYHYGIDVVVGFALVPLVDIVTRRHVARFPAAYAIRESRPRPIDPADAGPLPATRAAST